MFEKFLKIVRIKTIFQMIELYINNHSDDASCIVIYFAMHPCMNILGPSISNS